ncbi:MAG: DUF1800 domain-containing protein, partial [Pseudomonadota bacterium]
MERAAIAATRFGLGAAPGEISRIGAVGAETWLTRQITFDPNPAFPDRSLKSSKDHLASLLARRGAGRARPGDTQRLSAEAQRDIQKEVRQTIIGEITARSRFASETTAPFHERLTLFWSNHFSVTAKNPQTVSTVGAYEREAIRPNIAGSFATLLKAAVLHPAMLIFLDNVMSVGPNSRPGQRRGRGLNENLAREILELHTVSSSSGYDQEDVTEFARALTGWTVGNRRISASSTGETYFFSRIHEPGARQVMGKRYADSGREQALSILDDLARHPATARFVARKLAIHFIADAPPPSLVTRLERAFLESDGDLTAVYGSLITAPESWMRDQQKIKTPQEMLTSASRLLGLDAVFAGDPQGVFSSLAQRPFNAPSPEGWPDQGADWLGPDAVMKRIEWANRVAGRLGGADARRFLDDALGSLASAETRKA